MVSWHDISIIINTIMEGDIMPEPILYEQVYDLLYQTLDKAIYVGASNVAGIGHHPL
jgi:hypothetical protein